MLSLVWKVICNEPKKSKSCKGIKGPQNISFKYDHIQNHLFLFYFLNLNSERWTSLATKQETLMERINFYKGIFNQRALMEPIFSFNKKLSLWASGDKTKFTLYFASVT